MGVTRASALAWRLRRHYLTGPAAASVEEVVERLVAVPSWSGDAPVAIGQRLGDREPAPDPIRAALTEGRLVATYAFRGATHLMTPSSAAVHLALRAAGRQWERATWRSHYRLDPAEWPALRATVREALARGPLTQPELADAVARDPAYSHLRSAFTDRSHTFLKPFGWQGDLRLDTTGDALRFRSMDDVPGWDGVLPLDVAGPQAVRSYLGAYGPATRGRVHSWLGQGLSAGRRRIDGWLDGLGPEAVLLDVEGEPALCLAEHADGIATSGGPVETVLVPCLDQWVLGPGTADPWVVPQEHRAVVSRGAALVLEGGRVVGTWSREADGVRVDRFD